METEATKRARSDGARVSELRPDSWLRALGAPSLERRDALEQVGLVGK